MIFPPTPDDALCGRCAHRFDEHESTGCGCQLKCQRPECTCSDFDHHESVHPAPPRTKRQARGQPQGGLDVSEVSDQLERLLGIKAQAPDIKVTVEFSDVEVALYYLQTGHQAYGAMKAMVEWLRRADDREQKPTFEQTRDWFWACVADFKLEDL